MRLRNSSQGFSNRELQVGAAVGNLVGSMDADAVGLRELSDGTLLIRLTYTGDSMHQRRDEIHRHADHFESIPVYDVRDIRVAKETGYIEVAV